MPHRQFRSSASPALTRRHLLGLGALGALASLSLPFAARATTVTAPSLPPAPPPPPPDLMAHIRAAFDRHGARIIHHDVAAVVDFSEHSSRPRFQLINLTDGRTRHLLVAHGRGSDPAHTGFARSFSNREGSHASSLGAYATADAYVGQHGPSRRLNGLDPENDAAYSRAIVIHGANYVSAERAAHGPVGRSFGCFAFARADIAGVLDALGPGRLLLAIPG